VCAKEGYRTKRRKPSREGDVGDARILIVEDEVVVAKDAEAMLESTGYVVPGIALSGEEAIEQVAETEPDLVLMDIKLQGEMDGVEAAEEIHERFDVPVVYLTAYADDETLERAQLAAPFGYIVKPFGERELCSTVQMALYRHRMQRELRQRTAQLEALQDISLAITAQLDLDELLQEIVEQGCRLLDAAGASLYLVDETRGDLELVVSLGDAQDLRGARLRPGEGIAGEVLESGEAIRVDDYAAWEGRSPGWRDEGITGGLCVPLERRGRVIGTLGFEEIGRSRSFDEQDVWLATLFANQAAIAIGNAGLYEETERRATQAALINDVGRRVRSEMELDALLSTIVSVIRDTFDYYNVSLLLLDEEADQLRLQATAGASADQFPTDVSLALGEGMTGYAAATGETQLSNDVGADPHYVRVAPVETRSELVVPIDGGHQVIGVLDVKSDQLDAFDEMDVLTVETLSTQVAAAIENARLYEETAQRAAELSVLYDVITAAMTPVDLDEVLQRATSALKNALRPEPDAVAILLVEPGEPEDELVVRASSGFLEGPTVMRRSIGEGVPGSVVRTGQPASVPDVQEDERYHACDPRTRSELCVPLRVGDHIIGALNLESHRLAAFDEEDQRLVSILAGHLAAAIENARLYDRAQQEIVERKRAEKALRRRDAILEAVSVAAERWLGVTSWEEPIPGVLERLGEAARVSRVYVFKNQVVDRDTILTSHRYEWAAPGIASQIDNPELQDFPLRASGFGRWEERLSQGQPIHGHVREFPSGEREVLSAQGITSIVVVPIYVRQRWWGFMGFDECRRERDWSAPEIDALKAAANTLGAAIEREEMEQQLRQQDKMAALGQLAGGVAHDFNNILASIILYAQMPMRRPDLAPANKRALETILEESHRAADLVQQILDFSRNAMLETEPMSLVALVEEKIPLLRRTIPETIRLVTEMTSQPCTVQGDPTRLHQALMNLASNAIDAMPEGGELRIGVKDVTIAPDERPPLPDMPSGAWARLTVADTGAGMGEEAESHLFEPFFTTKEVGKGTGLGLAQVHGIVKQHGGFIDVDTKPGEGTTFAIFLPLVGDEGVEGTVERKDVSRQTDDVTILVIEDNERLRRAIQAGLESDDYHVLTAANGREALNTVPLEDVDLVLTDVVMPKMGGKTLLRELRRRAPQLSVIAMTGHIMDAGELQSAGFARALLKPFSMDDLNQAVRTVLDG